MSDINDRAVDALIRDAWGGEWERPIEVDDLNNAVALVMRVVRDDIALAWQRGEINDLDGAQSLLNERIYGLTGKQTITGDTT